MAMVAVNRRGMRRVLRVAVAGLLILATACSTSSGAVTTPPTTTPRGTDADAARAALDLFLDALAANRFGAARTLSDGPLASFAAVLEVVNQRNAARAGTTTSVFTQRAFDVSTASPDEIRFSGRAVMESTTFGPAGPPATSSHSFVDPVVRRGPNGWKAADAIYNGDALLAFPASATTSVGVVQLELSGALAFGDRTAAIVRLVTTTDHAVGVRDAVLRVDDSDVPATSATVVDGHPSVIYAVFPRHATPPTELRLTVTVDADTRPITLAFS